MTAVSLGMVVLLSVIAAAVDTAIQPPGKDAYVDQASATTNFGSATSLIVDGKTPALTGPSAKLKRTFVAFGLSSIPSGSIINSAKLQLFMYDDPSLSLPLEVHRITGSWTEAGITWNTQPANTTLATTVNLTGTTDNIFLSFDVTADVQAFVDGTATNNGWRIADKNEGDSGGGDRLAKFCSKEATTSDPDADCTTARFPKLLIDYTPPTCELTATSLPPFGPVNPGDTSPAKKTTLTNEGNININSLTLAGTDWLKVGGGASMYVGQTRWTTSSTLQDYDADMTNVTYSDVSLGITPFAPSATQDVFFKVRIPADQSAGNYEQTITFTFDC